MNFFLILIISSTFLASCSQVLKDVSSELQFSQLLNKSFNIKKKIYLQEITCPNRFKVTICSQVLDDYFYQGPEVYKTSILQPNVKFKIIKFVECTNCLASNPTYHAEIIFLTDVNHKKNIPISLDNSVYFIKNKETQKFSLTPKLFEPL